MRFRVSALPTDRMVGQMSRKTTTYKKPMVQALAALVAVLGVGLIGAAPARADHGPDVGFSFSFGFPAPFVPVYAPPVVVYREPVVVYERPVYRAPQVYYQQRTHGYWRHDRHHDRWDRRDRSDYRDRSGYRDARW